MRTFHRLHLSFLCLRPGNPNPNGFYFAGSSISVLIALSNLEQAHHKDSSMRYVLRNNLTKHNVHILYHNMSLVVLVLRPYGGPEEICTPVQNYFRLTSYDRNVYLCDLILNRPPVDYTAEATTNPLFFS